MHVKTNNWFFNTHEELSSTDMVLVIRSTKSYRILHHHNRPWLVSSAEGWQMEKPAETEM